MAVYKVLQDVEAEDKLVGPLTLKQFIYAAIAVICIFIEFRIFISADLGMARWLLIALFAAPMALFAVLASPLGGDQPTELWLLSHIKFMLKPRQRAWDQDGIVEGVTITVPKRDEANLTKNLSQGEVKSRLKALASMLDSRGWAIQSTPLYKSDRGQVDDSDRLVSSDVLSQAAPDVDIRVGDDLLDEQSNATAQRYGALVKEVEDQKKRSLADRLKAAVSNDKEPSEASQAWGVEAINPAAKQPEVIVHPTEPAVFNVRSMAEKPVEPEIDERALNERLKAAESALHARHPHFQEASSLTAERERRAQRKLLSDQSTKLNLTNSDNFSVATISSLANRVDGSGVPL